VAQRPVATKIVCGFVLLCVLACREHETPRAPLRQAPLETGIARDLTEKFGAPVTTRCVIIAGIAVCRAFVGGTVLSIAVKSEKNEWAWHVEGRAVVTAPIALRITGELADLDVAQTVDCGGAVVRVDEGERLVCKLSGGGAAFASIGKDGTVGLELAIDPAAAAVRTEVPHDLTKTSRDLERLPGEEDEEEVTGSGSAAKVPP
jgi:hypothetical protein